MNLKDIKGDFKELYVGCILVDIVDEDSIFETYLPAMYKFSYTDDLIDTFKSKGYRIYYLSNWDLYYLMTEMSHLNIGCITIRKSI